MEVKNKSFDIFKSRFPNRVTEERIEKYHESFTQDWQALSWGVFGEYNDVSKSFYYQAEISWSYSCKSVKKIFPCTLDGLIEACDWIDEQRVVFAELLL